MNKKQTAVEWIIEQIEQYQLTFNYSISSAQLKKWQKQAIAMEREQIEAAYDKGRDDGVLSLGFDPTDGPDFNEGKDYHTETYGK